MAVERAQKAINKMADERARFIEWVRSVPQEKWSNLSPDGMWQARDYVAHLASIDPLLTGLIRSFQTSGEVGRGPDGRPFSIDDWNEGQILERRTRPIEDLIADMEKHRIDLNAALADLTDEQLDRTFHFGGDKSRSPRDLKIAEFLNGLVYHDRWHMEDARRAIAGETEQAFGDEAFEGMMRGEAGGSGAAR
jgi:hypothetical protein